VPRVICSAFWKKWLSPYYNTLERLSCAGVKLSWDYQTDPTETVSGEKFSGWSHPSSTAKADQGSARTRSIIAVNGFDRVFRIVGRSTVALEWSQNPKEGGTVVLAEQEGAGRPQRRNYFRLPVPEKLKVNLVLSHLYREDQSLQASAGRCYCLQGTLVDISEGGAQIALGAESGLDFRPLQFTKRC
jgi:hypothetical protein